MQDHIHKFSIDSCGPQIDGWPSDPFVEIVLDKHSPSHNKHVSISPHLKSDIAIETYVTDLKKDLDRVCRMAKLELEKLRG